MSAKRMMSAVAVLAAMTLVSAVCAAPASALSDVSVDARANASTDPFRTQTISDDTAADAMPDNPDAALPDQVLLRFRTMQLWSPKIMPLPPTAN